MNLKFWQRQPVKVQLIHRESWKLKLKEWREAKNLVAESMALARNSTYRAQLDVLENEHPRHFGLLVNATTDQRAALQSQIQGYQLCLNNLRAMATPIKPKQELEAKFEEQKPPEKK